jgi:hypothetical protein
VESARYRQQGFAAAPSRDASRAIAISWQETNVTSGAVPVPGRVPTFTRELVVDVARLKAGEYVVQILMSRAGCAPAYAERGLSLER